MPDELVEAARIDGAGPMRFFWDVVLPLSKTSIAALFVIQFIYGWNQYLWPLLVTTDAAIDPELDRYMHLYTLNRGILMTPFHNMALISPETTQADVDHHTKVFREAVQSLFGN